MSNIEDGSSAAVNASLADTKEASSSHVISTVHHNTKTSEDLMNEILNILNVKIEPDNRSSKKKNTRQRKQQPVTRKYADIFSSNEELTANVPDKFKRNELQFKLHKLADHFKVLIRKDDLLLEEFSKVEKHSKKRKLSQVDDDVMEDNLKKFKKTADEALKSKESKKSITTDQLEEHELRKENDPFYNNPKSEYVEAQSLPKVVSMMGLFSEDESQKTEKFPNAIKKLNYLRAKYGVNRFPKRDLIADLPAKFPDLDLTQPKPTNQIQFSTFLSYIEPFFRKYVDRDEDFLMQDYLVPNRILTTRSIRSGNAKNGSSFEQLPSMESTFDELNENKIYDPNLTPYMIPKLGKFYYLKWFEENPNIISHLNNSSGASNSDGSNGPSSELRQLISKFPSQYNHIPQIVLPKGASSIFIKNNSKQAPTSVTNNTKTKGKGANKKGAFALKDEEGDEKSLDMDNAVSLGPLSTRLLQCIMTDVNLTEENDIVKSEVELEDLDGDNSEKNVKFTLKIMENKIKNQIKERKSKIKSEDSNGDINMEKYGDDEDDDDDDDDDDEEEEEDDDDDEEFDGFNDEDDDELIDEDGFEEIFEAEAINTNANFENSEQNGTNLENLVETSTVPFSWKIENEKILSPLNYLSFEDRIRQELKTLGVFGVANKSLGLTETENDSRNDINWVEEKEDDEICSKLRSLQVKLRAVSQKNNQRKRILRSLLKKHLAYQDYAQILENLNKQVDHEYARRLKNSHTKKKKKSSLESHINANQEVASFQQFQMQQQEIQHGIADVNLKKLLEKRKKWMDFIGILFSNQEYHNKGEETNDDKFEVDEGGEKVLKKSNRYIVSENDFVMDGVEDIGAQSLDPAVNMKRAPAYSIFKNMK